MALSYLSTSLSIDEYLALRKKQDKSTGRSSKSAYNNAQLFCQDQFQREFLTVMSDMQAEVLRSNQIDTVLIFLQRFVNWLSEPHLDLHLEPSAVYPEGAPCKKKEAGVIKGYISQTRLIMKKVGGIPITSEDLKDYKLSYPPPAEKEPPEPMTNDEFRLICDAQPNFKRQMLYRIMKDAEARIGSMVQLRKKHFDITKRPIEINFPASIMKKKNGVSYANTKYVIKEDEKGMLKLLEMTLNDESLVFGITEDTALAVNDEEKVWSKLVCKLEFTARYKHNNFLKKNLHSIKSLTFTAARKAVDVDYAHAYGDHTEYCKNYLRESDETKIGYFKKLEPLISVYTKIEVRHDDEELAQRNDLLQNQITNIEKQLQQVSENTKDETKIKLSPDQIKKVLKIIEQNNI